MAKNPYSETSTYDLEVLLLNRTHMINRFLAVTLIERRQLDPEAKEALDDSLKTLSLLLGEYLNRRKNPL